MPSVYLSPFLGAGGQFFTNSGSPLSGGKIFTYVAGTTTPQTTYTDSTGNVAQANPIILDSAGRVPNGGEVWLTAATYKFVVQDSTGVILVTCDNVNPSTPWNGNSPTFTSVTVTGATSMGTLSASGSASLTGITNAGHLNRNLPVLGAIQSSQSPYSVVAEDDLLNVRTNSGAVTINLPSSPVTGRCLRVVKMDNSVNNVTIAATGGQTLNGTVNGTVVFNTQWVFYEIVYFGDGGWVYRAI